MKLKANNAHSDGAKLKTRLKVGDPVMVISGGNKKKSNRQIKSQVGKIKEIITKKNRVVVEGLNMVTRHKRAVNPNEPSGKIEKEGAIHVSNVMYYHEDSKRPVRLSVKTLDDGRKVRGFINRETNKFEQV